MFGTSDKKKTCPLLNKGCIESLCMFWVHLYGRDGNTDQMVDVWDCSLAWLPKLLVETTGATRSTAAAVESFRNEMVTANAEMPQRMALAQSLLTHHGGG